jgi:predicted dehydrogenase
MDTAAPAVGIAVLGLGGFGAFAAEGIRGCAAVTLVGGFDPNPERVRAFATRFACRGFGSLDEVLAAPEVEAVFLASPNGVHREQAEQAAGCGRHVFCTKPIANTVADGLAMVQACGRAEVVFMVDNPPPVWGGTMEALKRAILAGQIGELCMAEAHLSSGNGLRLDPGQWRWYRDQCPSGSLHQLGVYQANALHYLIGPAKRVSAFFNRLHTKAEIPDVTATVIEFDTGVLGYLGSSYVADASPSFLQLHGTRGTLSLGQDGPVLKGPDGVARQIDPATGGPDHSHGDLLASFAGLVRARAYRQVDAMPAVQALAIIDAATRSAALGRPVVLREVFPDLYR